jgi:thiamine biosynthesis protein ThiS
MSDALTTPQATPRDMAITVRTDRGPVQLPEGSTVADALVLLVGDTQPLSSMATAVNGEFVSRHERPSHRLQDGDALLLFGAITGG